MYANRRTDRDVGLTTQVHFNHVTRCVGRSRRIFSSCSGRYLHRDKNDTGAPFSVMFEIRNLKVAKDNENFTK